MNFKSVFQNFYSMNSLYIILQIIFFIENANFASGVKKDQEKGLEDVKNPLHSQGHATFHSMSAQAKSMDGGRSMLAPIKAVKKPTSRKGKMVAEKAKKRPNQIVVKKPDDMPELPEIFMKPDVWKIVLNELQNDHKLPVGDENIRIKAAHMATLRDGYWLNDEVINGYMHLLTKNHQLYVYINTFHTALYISKSVLHISWLNRINFERKLPVIFVPAHLNGNHWALAFISFAHETIMIFDSMRLPLNVVTTKLNSKKVTKTHFLLKMFTLVKDIYEIKGRQQQFDGWKYKLMKKIPLQGNTDDCGVFILAYAKYLVDVKRITFTQEHIPYFRRLICSELMETVKDASEASNVPAGVNPSISQKHQMPAAVHLLDIPSKIHLPKHLDGIITSSPKITSTVSEWKKIFNLYIGGKNELNLPEDTKVKDDDKGKGKIVEEGNIPLSENILPSTQEVEEESNGPPATQNNENNFDEIDFGKLNLNEIRRTIASLDEDLANHGNSPTTIHQQFNQADHQFFHQSSFNDPNLVTPFTSAGNLANSDLVSNIGQHPEMNKSKEPKFPQNMYVYQIQMEALNNKLLNNINKNEEVTADLREIENDLNGKNEENLSDFEKLLERRRLELIAEKEVLEAEEKKLNEELTKLKQN